MDMTPTNPEGSYWEFLQMLWQSTADAADAEDGPALGWRGSPIAEVAFFRHGFVRAWYFTAKDGTVKRKQKKSLSVAELSKRLCAGNPLPSANVPLENDPGEVVALAVFGPDGLMDLRGRMGSSVAALERGPLRWLLDVDDAQRRHELQAVVKYVRNRGEREAVLRFDWRAQVSQYELRSAMAPLQAGSSHTVVPAYQRLSTHGPVMYYSEKERHVPEAAVRKATEVCEGLASRIAGKNTPREEVHICADFKLLGGDKVVLLWAGSAAGDEAFPAYAFPASMKAAELPQEATAAPPREPVRLALLQAQPKSGRGSSKSSSESAMISSARGSRGSSEKVPGLNLLCSRYFICRGCGRTEPRNLALQPARDMSAYRAMEVYSGEGAPDAHDDPEAEDDVLEELLRPQNALLPAILTSERAKTLPSSLRPTTATASATARLASPRLIVRTDAGGDGGTSNSITPLRGTIPGWHQAAMCAECAAKEAAPVAPPRRAEALSLRAKKLKETLRLAEEATGAADPPTFATLKSARTYLPEQYAEHSAGLPIRKTVHVEAMCDSAIGEALWVEGLADAGRCNVAAIVAGVNLADEDAEAQLDEIKAKCPRLRGNRYIIDYAGPFDGGNNATHPNMVRHGGGGGVDYLRDPAVAPAFEKGFAALAVRGLSFDLQCAPEQLPAAAALCAKYPMVPVVIDHMGKPRHLLADGSAEDTAKITEWRQGMKLMAALPQVCVKLSMLGYAVPGWHADAAKEALLKSLVLETIELFGPARCMFASNFHISAAGSDSDGKSDTGPEMPELYGKFESWVADRSEEDKVLLFAGAAEAFYKI